MILIISKQIDEHAEAVGSVLKKMKESFEIIDLSEFPQFINIAFQYNGGNADFFFTLKNGEKIDLSKVKSIWWRRPQSFELHPEITKSSHQTFALNESFEAITGLWHSLDAHWINIPANDEVAQRKVYQLKMAGKIGFDIPKTLVTNNPEQANQFLKSIKSEKVIYKAFSATRDEWRETRLVKPNEVSLIQNVKYAPVIFQEYIEAKLDLRITVIGDQIFPAAIYSQETSYKIDVRMDMDNAKIQAHKLPQNIKKKISRYMKVLGLEYGAIDMRLTPNGTYVFLEINPAGQFLFIEERTGQKITEALAQNLSKGK